MTLPEVREDAAPPEVAALYAQLRQGLGVPLVNLVYRHLATLPGVLPWVWAAIRPAVESGRLAGARARLAAALPLPVVPPIPAADWCGAGLTGADRDAVAVLVETYNRGNLGNLIVLTALRRALDGEAKAAAPPAPGASEAPLPVPPPVPRFADLPATAAAAVRSLAARHDAAENGAIPSLYLHLAHWPGLPGALSAWLGPALEPSAIRAGRATAMRFAVGEADALRPSLALTPLPPRQEEPLRAVLASFTGGLIPDMVPVGLALRRALPTF